MNEAKRDGVVFQVRYKDEIIDVYGFCSIGSGAQFIYCNTKNYKWLFVSRKKLERLVNQWLIITTDINNSIANKKGEIKYGTSRIRTKN